MGFIWYIIIGIVAGFLAGKIMRGGGFGLVINLLLGILGGVLGGWVFALFGLSASGLIGSLITSTVPPLIAFAVEVTKLLHNLFMSTFQISPVELHSFPMVGMDKAHEFLKRKLSGI